MNQILCCDWLPERARWCYLDHSGLRPVSSKKNFPEAEAGSPKYSFVICAENIFFVTSLRFPEVSVSMELENGKTKSVSENENKENENVEEFHEFILQRKPASKKVKTQSDMKA